MAVPWYTFMAMGGRFSWHAVAVGASKIHGKRHESPWNRNGIARNDHDSLYTPMHVHERSWTPMKCYGSQEIAMALLWNRDEMEPMPVHDSAVKAYGSTMARHNTP